MIDNYKYKRKNEGMYAWSCGAGAEPRELWEVQHAAAGTRAAPGGGGGGGQGDRAFVPVHDPEPEGRLPDERRHDGFCVALPFLLFLLVCRRHAP